MVIEASKRGLVIVSLCFLLVVMSLICQRAEGSVNAGVPLDTDANTQRGNIRGYDAIAFIRVDGGHLDNSKDLHIGDYVMAHGNDMIAIGYTESPKSAMHPTKWLIWTLQAPTVGSDAGEFTTKSREIRSIPAGYGWSTENNEDDLSNTDINIYITLLEVGLSQYELDAMAEAQRIAAAKAEQERLANAQTNNANAQAKLLAQKEATAIAEANLLYAQQNASKKGSIQPVVVNQQYDLSIIIIIQTTIIVALVVFVGSRRKPVYIWDSVLNRSNVEIR